MTWPKWRGMMCVRCCHLCMKTNIKVPLLCSWYSFFKYGRVRRVRIYIKETAWMNFFVHVIPVNQTKCLCFCVWRNQSWQACLKTSEFPRRQAKCCPFAKLPNSAPSNCQILLRPLANILAQHSLLHHIFYSHLPPLLIPNLGCGKRRRNGEGK